MTGNNNAKDLKDRMERVHRAWMGWAASASICALGPADAAPPLETYGRLPATELVELSPSGERIALVAVDGETRKLVIVASTGKLVKALAVGNTKVRSLAWAGNDHLLVFMSATVNEYIDLGLKLELFGVTSVGLGSQKPWSVFQSAPGIAHTIFGYFGAAERDHHWVAYFGGITLARGGDETFYLDHSYRDLYRVDLDTGKATLEAKGSDRDHDWLVGPDGAVTAHTEYDDKSGMWRLYAGARGALVLEKTSPTHEIDMVGAGRAPGTVLVVDRTGAADNLEEINLTSGKAERLLADHDTLTYLFDHETGLLIGATTHEEPGTVLFDPKFQARANGARKAFPDLQVALVSHDAQFQKLIVRTDGGDDSGSYYLVDIGTRKADALGYEYPDVKPSDVAATQIVKYQAGDGLALEGILTLPVGREAKRLPFVMFPHGGPIDAEDRIGFDWWAQAFAARGYAVFQPNYRGSGGHGRDFREAGYGQWGRKMLSDIADAIGELGKRGIVDPSRACIMGASYGGYAALAGVTLQKGLYRCAVSVAGPADLQRLLAWHIDRDGRDGEISRYYRKVTGVDTEGEGILKTISPALHAESADAPILLIHGKDDTRVPIEQSEFMASALKHAGKPCEFVELPHEDHFLSREATRIAMLKASVAFVEKYNPP